MDAKTGLRFDRRALLKYGGAALIGVAAELPSKDAAADDRMTSCAFKADPDNLTESLCTGQRVDIEFLPTSPFIQTPFIDDLPIPPPLEPITADGLKALSLPAPSPAAGRQSSDGTSTHSLWPSDIPAAIGGPLPEPKTYLIRLQNAKHSWTSSKVRPINALGQPVVAPGKPPGDQYLPASDIWSFNGTFPGSMINARYGEPNVVRFKDEIVKGPIQPQTFGSPKGQFLIHLHNGHTAPESDGNPHFRPEGYSPGDWVDNLYLNWPPDGDDNEKQSTLWFHDHFEAYTGANVYKGLVGFYPIYDEEHPDHPDVTISGKPTLDPGDETRGLRLPGVRRPLKNTFAVDYDVPLIIHDVMFDDGVTPHHDFHNGCGEYGTWGEKFFKHYPNHGFVGDIFTVNGKAFPVLKVKQRRYRFRFLDASIARVYKFLLMKSSRGEVEAPGTQGQWLLPDGQKAMPFVQIASEGGLLPYPLLRDSIEVWPSRRKEVVLDFKQYMDAQKDQPIKNNVLYLVNVMQMLDGRKPDSDDPAYKVPVLKIVIETTPTVADDSLPFLDAAGRLMSRPLRPLPNIDFSDEALAKLPHRTFELQRGGTSGGDSDDPVQKALDDEFEWGINGRPFQVCVPLASPQKAQPEVWRVKNGGGGWVHPMHFHMEEHRIFEKNGVRYNKVTPVGSDDVFAKEDTISLGPGEEVVMYRNFRTFPTRAQAQMSVTAKYVAHCHNLAHEDHSMMFGWQIVDKKIT
jgi:FtsP/CotA-like multicopper oxidase with cupredoxin domain